jgi:hypothetical protein
VSDVIPYVKAAGAVGGTLIPLMMRRNDELDAMAKFGFRQRGLIGYHGSPHKFSKFDHSMMGSGEGAQAYGWGTYLADRQGVARTYINPEGSYKRLSGHLPPKTEMAYDFLENGYSDSDTLFKMQEYYGDNADFDEIWGAIQDAQKQGAGTGNLYEVDLPDEQIEKMLDWDAPLSEQPEEIKKILKDLPKPSDEYEIGRGAGTMGYQLYDKKTGYLNTDYNFKTEQEARDFLDNMTGGDYLSGGNHGPMQREVSEQLRELGIPGIKYFDGDSRAAGEGTRNFVVFDEDLMTILKRNGEELGLPMDEASRMARAKEMGNTTDAYTGTTHNIHEFDASIANPESDWGKGVYATTSIDDVNQNYAGMGPDLTQRVELEAERVADELMDYPDELLDKYGISASRYADDEAGVADEIARKRLVGEAGQGVVYPIKINTEKYAVIGGPNSTKLEQPDYYDLARSEVSKADYAYEIDWEDAVSERAWELQTDDTDSLYYRVREALMDTDAYQYEQQINDVMESIQDDLIEGTLDVDTLDDAIRNNITEAFDDATGEMSSPGAVSAQTLKNLGFEGVIDNKVNQKFGAGRQFGVGMAGIDNDTQHIVTFPDYEKRIRSKYATFDKTKKNSADILAGGAAAAIGAGALLDKDSRR